MFGSDFLDVALGLVLVFLLVSLALTALQEMLEAFLKSRAKDLETAIRLMVEQRANGTGGGSSFVKQFYDHNLIYGLYKGSYPEAPAAPATGALAKLKSKFSSTTLPSYIPRDVFSTVVLDLYGKGTASPELADTVGRLKHLYGGDVDRIRGELESWYDGAMDRASGWYKRRTQGVIFTLGLVAAAAFNINAIAIADYLSHSRESRLLVAGLAQEVAKQGQAPASNCNPAPTATATGSPGDQKPRAITACDLQGEIEKLGLPIGWSKTSRDQTFRQLPKVDLAWSPKDVDAGTTAVLWAQALLVLVGWILTALAASLGAPFWFDMLNKVMVIRSTVKPTEKSPNEKSEDGGSRPAPRPAPAPAAVPAPPVGGAATSSQNDEVVG